MATPTPMSRQRDAATLQPSAEKGRGPKGVFHLTPRALSNLSAATAKYPGMARAQVVLATAER